MRSGIVLWTLLVVVSASAATPQRPTTRSRGTAKSPAVLKWSDLAVELSGVTRSQFQHTVDLGLIGTTKAALPAVPQGSTCRGALDIADAGPVNVTLGLKNLSTTPHELRLVAVGSKIAANWVQAPAGDAMVLQPNTSEAIAVAFSRENEKLQDYNAVLILSGRDIATIVVFDYVLVARTIPLELRSGDVPSSGANVTNWDVHKYRLVTGAAPPGYDLASACHWLTGDRGCNHYSTCTFENVDNSDVVFAFALQGHNEGSPDVRHSDGHLTVVYKVRESAPVLK